MRRASSAKSLITPPFLLVEKRGGAIMRRRSGVRILNQPSIMKMWDRL
jgi:hypothetical protein